MSLGRRTKCFVPECKAGYSFDRKKNKEKGVRNPSMFSAPKDDQLFKLWFKAIPRADRRLEKNDVVCELHFTEDQIVKTYDTKMADGKIVSIERGKFALKENAVPSVFPNLPSHLSKILKKRKSPLDRITSSKKPKSDLVNGEKNSHDELTSQETDLDHSLIENRLKNDLFTELKSNLITLELPNNGWISGYSKEPEEMMFFKINDSYEVRKTVILSPDLSVKVLFGNKTIEHNSILKTVQYLKDIGTILKAVDQLMVCEGLKTISLCSECTGLAIKQSRPKDCLTNMCLSCKNVSKIANGSFKMSEEQCSFKQNKQL